MKKGKIYGIVTCIIILFIAVVFGFSKMNGADSSKASNKTIRVLTYANWNPFEYLKNGKLVGFDVDLIKELSKEAGYKYTIKNASWESMFTQLQQGKADVGISGITITSDRGKTFAFSNPYFVSRQSIVVPQNSTVKSASDLKNSKIAVQTGSTGQEAAKKLFGKDNSKILATQSGVTFQMVMHGQADAAIGDNTNNEKFIENNKENKLKIVKDDKAFTPEYFGLMFPKGTSYKKAYDKALKKLIADGTYQKIYKKWFGVTPNTKELSKFK
ncbi:basic amino acid ABC transporter substrate-binding protein [Liquorilactobacillus uvarum]|uniref:basic amino acid ABC transporter substrate-binding protein n=2 Tax=Liquorilactobacillus uvarum TaxID=303240 RepID=UPI00288ABDD3|nr:basic amino acid ABC transporter substrate-binding protein [Liquorilactobacillus uvarum]